MLRQPAACSSGGTGLTGVEAKPGRWDIREKKKKSEKAGRLGRKRSACAGYRDRSFGTSLSFPHGYVCDLKFELDDRKNWETEMF